MSGPVHVCLIAGEHSGDHMGANLMRAIIARTQGAVRFSGIGGEEMTAAGAAHSFQSFFPMAELSIGGIVEVVPHIPNVLRRVRETAAQVRALRPDVVVTIDSPAFAFRVGRKLKGSGIDHVHYVAPTVWAWRPRRARMISRFLKHLLLIFPFEAPYFEKWGLACTFVGHPVNEQGIDAGDGPGFRARHGIAADARLLCVLPGSRRAEVGRLLPVFAAAVERIAKRVGGLAVVVPTVAGVRDRVRAAVRDWPVPVTVTEGAVEKRDAFAAADLALCASGTVTYELAAAGVPMVIAYRMSALSAAVIRAMIRVRHVSVVNLVLGEPVAPELLQGDCTPKRLADAVVELLEDDARRGEQRRKLDRVAEALGRGGPPSSARAAEVVLAIARGEEAKAAAG